MSKSYVILSDIHAPCHDKKAFQAAIEYIADFQPDEVVQIGDLLDLPEPVRRSKEARKQVEESMFRHTAHAREHILKPLRNVYDGPVKIVEGDHELRARKCLEGYAPADGAPEAPLLEVILDFHGLGIEWAPDFYEFTPNWLMTHGHLGKISLSKIAGSTAADAAKKMDVNVIMGHTHRLGMGSHTTGYGGEVSRTVTGVECGHLMDKKQLNRPAEGTADWQQGFVVAHVDDGHVDIEMIPLRGRKQKSLAARGKETSAPSS